MHIDCRPPPMNAPERQLIVEAVASVTARRAWTRRLIDRSSAFRKVICWRRSAPAESRRSRPRDTRAGTRRARGLRAPAKSGKLEAAPVTCRDLASCRSSLARKRTAATRSRRHPLPGLARAGRPAWRGGLVRSAAKVVAIDTSGPGAARASSSRKVARGLRPRRRRLLLLQGRLRVAGAPLEEGDVPVQILGSRRG